MIFQLLLEVLYNLILFALVPLNMITSLIAPFLNSISFGKEVITFLTYAVYIGFTIFSFILGSNTIALAFINFLVLSFPIRLLASIIWTIYSKIPIIGKGK